MDALRNGSDVSPQRFSVLTTLVAIATAGLIEASDGGSPSGITAPEAEKIDVSQLWQAPTDIASRDLFLGAVHGVPVPDPTASYTFVGVDRGGYSPGYDVRDVNGTMWSVKLGPEAQTEVVASRILWAIGYHQIPTYYLPSWTIIGGPTAQPGPARFRPELEDRKVVGDWSWKSAFTDAQPFRGLIVANLILNNWDWKTSNNKIYEVTGSDGPRRVYVVRDLGASLGKTSSPRILRWAGLRGGQGSRNDLEDFEHQGFIRRVTGDRVEFDYKGIYTSLVDTVTIADVVWTSRLLSQLSDAQWSDAFRAGGYPPDRASRYIAKLKSKIDEGLALAQNASD